tara:strand:+ start:6356 stop:6883 length:528 start_codon:yes stop_codon:yes gene_type:complete
MYFENFPLTIYDSVGDGNYKIVTHLLKRIAARSKVKRNVALYDTYDIKEGETPEILADKLYGDPELHWVILLFNDITDVYHQWPQNQNQFLAYLKDKYSNVDATHHYEISQTSGDTTIKIDIGTDNTDYPAASIVTNYEYEEDLQDKKRKVKLLDPAYVEDFVTEFEELMGEDTA